MSDAPPSAATLPALYYLTLGAVLCAVGAAIAITHLDPQHWVAPWSTRFVPPFDDALVSPWGRWFTPFLGEQRFGFLLIALGIAIASRRPWAPHLGMLVAIVAGLALIIPLTTAVFDLFVRYYDAAAPGASISLALSRIMNQLLSSGRRGLAAITVIALCTVVATTMILRPLRAPFKPRDKNNQSTLWCITLCITIAATQLPDVIVLAIRFIVLDAYGIEYAVGDTLSSRMAVDEMVRFEIDSRIATYIYARYFVLAAFYAFIFLVGHAISRTWPRVAPLAWAAFTCYAITTALQYLVHRTWTPRAQVGFPVLVLPNEQYHILPHLTPIYYFRPEDFILIAMILLAVAILLTWLQHLPRLIRAPA